MSRRVFLWGAAASLVAVSAAAQSRLFAPAAPRVELTDAWGESLPTFRHRGTTYVLGERGDRYVVSIHNPTDHRLEVVLSVDGRDAISGQVADYRRQRGYIVSAHDSLSVEGFRTSLDAVATFRFSDVEQSYSARRGTPQNVGIIGVAFYRERPRRRFTEPYRADSPAPPRARRVPSAPGDASKSKRYEGDIDHLGTEFGEVRDSRVREVPFERASAEPQRVVTLRYDDAEGLRSRGIDVEGLSPRVPARQNEPEAFPASRFASPPPTENYCDSRRVDCGGR